jgi:hypothetical protein
LSTETCPVIETTLAAASGETGNNWAEQICAAAITNSPQTNPWMPLSLIKLT